MHHLSRKEVNYEKHVTFPPRPKVTCDLISKLSAMCDLRFQFQDLNFKLSLCCLDHRSTSLNMMWPYLKVSLMWNGVLVSVILSLMGFY